MNQRFPRAVGWSPALAESDRLKPGLQRAGGAPSLALRVSGRGVLRKSRGCKFASDGSVRGWKGGGADYRNEYVIFAWCPSLALRVMRVVPRWRVGLVAIVASTLRVPACRAHGVSGLLWVARA